MSYILDALRKSERERAAGRIPTLHGAAAPVPGRHPAVFWVLLLIVVVVAGAGWWWYRAPGIAVTSTAPSPAPTAQKLDLPPAPVPPAAVQSAPVIPAPVTRTDTINVLSYSADPGRRFVMIDQVIYREGQTTRSGATVKEITPRGVVLSGPGGERLVAP